MTSLEVLNRVGNFPQRPKRIFFSEDGDYGRRCRAAGLAVGILRDIVVYHACGPAANDRYGCLDVCREKYSDGPEYEHAHSGLQDYVEGRDPTGQRTKHALGIPPGRPGWYRSVTMPVSVRQILELDVLKQAGLLAGSEAALDRKVTSVTVGEVPDIAEWLSGGEMVLTTFYAVKGDPERQREFCTTVMMADAAALFVKTTRFVDELPADVIELANKRKFPIIEVPQDLRWTRLMQDATELIINRQASLLERSRSIHRGLLGVVIRGGTWQELVDEVSKLLERRVVVLDSSLEVLGSSKDLPISVADLKAHLERPACASRSCTWARAEKLFRFRG